MTTAIPTPEPNPDDIARGLAELERHLASQDPAPVPARPLDDNPGNPADLDDLDSLDGNTGREVTGETRRVQRLRAEYAEARLLAELQDDDLPLTLDSPKVRKRRKRAHEAARLHALANDPAALAYRDQKVRRLSTVMVMAAASIALLVSSIGVQASVAAALDLDPQSIGWWAAFGVEPALSLPLLAAVGVQAYSAMRGRVVDRKSPEGRKLFRTEALLLGLTLVLNCWPAFTSIWTGFDLLPLIVHSLGPVAAVTAIWALPTLWSVLAALPVTGTAATPTALTYRANGADIAAHAARVRDLIATGDLPETPSASRIQRTLRCGMDTARAVRDALNPPTTN